MIQTASFSGFLRILFYIFLFYYLFKFLARLFLPFLIKKAIEKTGQKFQQQYQQNTWNQNQEAGDIIYDKKSTQRPKETKKVGEYVDYEEIE